MAENETQKKNGGIREKLPITSKRITISITAEFSQEITEAMRKQNPFPMLREKSCH